jgi:NAD(P)-dependent dehydrogenase (short-subunit alcohol dehydrogenase family)
MDTLIKEHRELMETLLSEIPLGLMGRPEEIASLGLCLASDASSYYPTAPSP